MPRSLSPPYPTTKIKTGYLSTADLSSPNCVDHPTQTVEDVSLITDTALPILIVYLKYTYKVYIPKYICFISIHSRYISILISIITVIHSIYTSILKVYIHMIPALPPSTLPQLQEEVNTFLKKVIAPMLEVGYTVVMDKLKRAREKRAELLRSGNLKRLSPVEKSIKQPKSLRKAIDAKCYECFGSGADGHRFTVESIDKCTSFSCPLYPVRPYQKKV